MSRLEKIVKLAAAISVIMSLPHTLAKKYEIQAHSNLLVIDTGEGILLKKIQTGTV
jgi:hypothetical protein